MLLVSYIQQYVNTSITVLTNQVWKLLIVLFKVPSTGAFTVCTFSLESSTKKKKKNRNFSYSKFYIFKHKKIILYREKPAK